MNTSKTIPAGLGILLVLLVVGGFILFFENISRAPTNAGTSFKPQDVRFTNLSDTLFTVVWKTDVPTTGSVVLSSSGLSERTVPDDRDVQGKPGTYTYHHVTYRGAQPKTSYHVKIISNGKKYGTDKEQAYTVLTPAQLPQSDTVIEPAFGKVLTKENLPADGAVVIASLEGGQELSTLVKTSGSWLIPFHNSRTADANKRMGIGERHSITLSVYYQDDDARAVTDTLNDSPVPTIVIGKEYDFRKQQANDAAPSLSATDSTTLADVPSKSDILGESNTTISITNPKQDESLSSTLPLFQGTALPGKQSTVTYGISQPVTETVKVGPDGIWRLTPKKPLPPGKQSITLTTQKADGKPYAVTHTFQIFKSGTQVLGDATPSATLTSTITPTPSLTPTGQPQLTPTPTPTPVSTDQIPVSATVFPTFTLTLMACVLLTIGAFLII